MPPDAVELPGPEAAAEALRAWAEADARLSFLLTSGVLPGQALARFGLWRLQADRGVDAVSVFRAALAFAPADPLMWTNLAIALDRTAATDEAATCLEHSLELSHKQPETWLLMGTLRMKRGDRAGAEAAYRTALDQNPGLAPAWHCLGLIKQEQREYTAAIDCFVACVERGGATAEVLANLARLYFQVGRFPEARQTYLDLVQTGAADARSREMLHKTQFMVDLIGGASTDEAIAVYRQSHTTEDAVSDAEIHALVHKAFTLLIGYGHVDAAARVGQKCLEFRPGSHSSAYLLRALAGGAGLDRAPSAYLTEHFDEFADGFDAQLVGVLGYDIPEKLVAAARAVLEPGRLYDALDAGCGTGLCGMGMRPVSRRLTGVDLSPKMLAQAQRRMIYDELVCEELTTFLCRSKAQFDLVIAADVMIYFGDLHPLMAAAAAAIRPGGWLAFSTELLAGDGYQILNNGRFTHTREYVRDAAGDAFTEHSYTDTTVRLEAADRVHGSLFVLRRK